jgi:hypothetical protein
MSPGKIPRGWTTGAAAMLALALVADVAVADKLLNAAGRSKRSGLPLLVMVSTGAG